MAREPTGKKPPTNDSVTPELIMKHIEGSFPGDLGIESLEVDDEKSVGRIVVDERHLHPGGYVHGGVWTAFADSVAAWGTFRHLQPGHDFTTLELELKVFSAAILGDELIATATPLHIGRQTQAWECRIVKRPAKGGEERLAANFTLTQFILPPK